MCHPTIPFISISVGLSFNNDSELIGRAPSNEGNFFDEPGWGASTTIDDHHYDDEGDSSHRGEDSPVVLYGATATTMIPAPSSSPTEATIVSSSPTMSASIMMGIPSSSSKARIGKASFSHPSCDEVIHDVEMLDVGDE